MPPVSTILPAAIQPAQYAQNGKVVPAAIETEMRNQLNFAARWRTKEVFRFGSSVPTTVAGTVDRWRAYGHSGPMTDRLGFKFIAGKVSDTATEGSITVYAYDSANVLLGSTTVSIGTQSAGTPSTPDQWIEGDGEVAGVTADTDYHILVNAVNARLIGMSVYEKTLDPTTANGYLSTAITATSPIYTLHRSEVSALANSMHKRGAAQTWNFTVDDQSAPATWSTTSTVNFFDTTLTTVSASSPGVTLDMRYKASLGRASTGVPMILRVYGKTSSAAGSVLLKDSGGTTLATVTTFSTTAGWVSSGTFNLPATKAKYDIMMSATSPQVLSVYAFSLYEYIA